MGKGKPPAYRRKPIVLSTVDRLELVARFREYGLFAKVFHSSSGSAYVSVREARDNGSEIALIRLSGHNEGANKNATHCAIGDRSQCMTALTRWVESIGREYQNK